MGGEEQPLAEPDLPVKPVTEADLDDMDSDDEEEESTTPGCGDNGMCASKCAPVNTMNATNSTMNANSTIPVIPTNSTEVPAMANGSTRTDSAETASFGVEQDGSFFAVNAAEDEDEELGSEDEEDDRPRESHGMFGTLFAEAVSVESSSSTSSFVKPTNNANVLEIDPSFMNKFNAVGVDFEGLASFSDALASSKKKQTDANEPNYAEMDFSEASALAKAKMAQEMTALRQSIKDNVPAEGTGSFSKSSDYDYLIFGKNNETEALTDDLKLPVDESDILV